MGLINIDYNDTINKAGTLNNLGNNISAISKRELSNIGNNISYSWKGDSSNTYLKKYNKINTQINSRGIELVRIAESMKKSAMRMKAIEDYAKTLFGG